MIKVLLNKKIYSEEFKKIKHKLAQKLISSDSYNVTESITANWAIRNEDFIIKNIIKTIKEKTYETPIAREKDVFINKKQRLLYAFDWHELVLQGAISNALLQIYEPLFSDSLQSYRKGRGSHNTLFVLSKYLKAIPENKSVFILRKDIKSYGDTIPHEKLFEMLKETLDEKDYLFELIKKIIQFKYYDAVTGKLQTKQIGLPTGSPLNNVMTNIFLTDLDKTIDQFSSESCYYRYGDDILVATQSRAIADKISTVLTDMILSKDLKFNEEKDAGFNFDEVQNNNSRFKYLGLMMDLKGNIRLTPEKDTEFKNEIKNLISKMNIMTKKVTKNKDETILVLNKTLKQLFLRTQITSQLLSYFPVVNDEEYWRQLDLWIAKKMLSVLYSKSGARVFKNYPFKKLREKGLPSLRHLRRLYLYDRDKFRKVTS